MEKEINIAAILKDKPNAKLWSPAIGECNFRSISMDGFIMIEANSVINYWFSTDGRLFREGECLLFPSKPMRDWSKFAWKKGDVLTDNVSTICMFDSWANNDYTEFNAKYSLHLISSNNAENEVCKTNDFVPIVKDEDKQSYLATAEIYFNVNLTKGSLKVEKPEFKDGDIVRQGVLKGTNIYIIKTCTDKNSNKYDYYARYNTREKEVNYNDWSHISPNAKLATIEEIRELFIALDKDGKAWDADKKAIVDLPKKCEFKAFDKVLVRDYPEDMWIPRFFAANSGSYSVCTDGDAYQQCIPYNDQTAHLLYTTDDWEGGEK